MATTTGLTTLVATRSAASSTTRPRLSASTFAVLALGAAAMFWGTSFVAAKAVLQDVPPITLACARFAVAAVVLVPIVRRSGVWPAFGVRPAVLGLTGIALLFLCQNAGLRHATAANATVILAGGFPVLATVLGAVFLRERPTRWQLAGLACSLAGVAAVALAAGGGALGVSLRGEGLLVLACAFGAAYSILGRRAFVGPDLLPILAGNTLYGVLFLAPASMVELSVTHMDRPSLAGVFLLLYLGVGCSAVAFALWAYALRHLTAAQNALVGNLELPIGLAAAALLLGEALGSGQLAGGALVLAGAGLAAIRA